MRRASLPLALALTVLASIVRAEEPRFERLEFPPGASSTSVSDTLRGQETVHYFFTAKEGSRFEIQMEASGDAHFNLFKPGSDPGTEPPLYMGPIGGRSFEVELPWSGEYRILVFQMRPAALAGELSTYTLEVFLEGSESSTDTAGTQDPQLPPEAEPERIVPVPDAKVDGTGYHAVGEIPCARRESQPMGRCEFGVVRRGDGDAEVSVFYRDGTTRRIVFEDGKAVTSDGSGSIEVETEGDLHRIRIGDERYEIPDAVPFGG